MEKITREGSYTLVGKFMGHWALCETMVDRAIGAALNLNPTQFFLISKTLNTRQKMDMLSVLIKSSRMNEEEKDYFEDIVTWLNKIYQQRNTLAHNAFDPTEDGTAVEFFTVKTNKGEVRMPETKWSKEDFSDCLGKIGALMRQLIALTTMLKQREVRPKLAQVLSEVQTKSFAALLDEL